MVDSLPSSTSEAGWLGGSSCLPRTQGCGRRHCIGRPSARSARPGDVVRLFAAVVLPDDVLADLEAAVARHRDELLAWTLPEQWHITLAFYGQVADDRVANLKARLTRAARRYQVVSLALDGAGRFDERTLWVGCSGDVAALRDIARSVTAAGRRVGAGSAGDAFRFRAHVTLARTRGPVNLRPYVAALDAYRSRSWTVDSVSLLRSHLGAGPERRSRYELLSTHPLAS
jgi:RNA 2',3'-cyclic 3'-phosphodiesterase